MSKSVEVEVVTKETLTLKPCPFCGETANLSVVDLSPDSEKFAVVCGGCDAVGPYGKNLKAAIATNWNIRRRQKTGGEE
jgi:Lar family restriction alleviation protein